MALCLAVRYFKKFEYILCFLMTPCKKSMTSTRQKLVSHTCAATLNLVSSTQGGARPLSWVALPWHWWAEEQIIGVPWCLLGMQNVRSLPRPLDSELIFDKIPGGFLGIAQSERVA